MTTNENDKTSIYGGSENEKTNVYGESNSNKTEAYGDISQSTGVYSNSQQETSSYTEQANTEFKSKTHGIGVGDTIILKNITYTIVGIISEGTGEAVIYKIEDPNHKIFVLKLYFEFGNFKEEPNHETLKRIKDITDQDILKLHEFGVGADKFQGKFCFEISDFAEGGDLFTVNNFKDKYTPEFIEQHVVKEIFLGIRRLHDNKIFHCDLKPQNVFYLDSNQTDLVIGDYGSAKAYDLESLKDIRKSSTVKGTDAFLPPEQARGIISEKNDYYSFGMILLHLLYPEEFASNSNIRVIDKKKFEKIIERQYNTQPIIDYNPSYKRLNNLIEGLTLVNHINRFGKEELERWLSGEELEVKYKSDESSTIQPVKLGFATITTAKDFINVLETHNTWWEDIFEDVDTYFALKAWLGSYLDISSRKVFDEMVHFYKPLGKEYVKEAALRYFDPQRQIIVDMHSYNFANAENVNKLAEDFVAKIDDIWKFTKIEDITFYLFQFEFTLRQLVATSKDKHSLLLNSIIDKFYAPFKIIPKPFDDYKTEIQIVLNASNEVNSLNQLLELFYIFNEKRTFKDLKNNQQNSLQDIGFMLILEEELFTNKYVTTERTKYFRKINSNNLTDLGYKDLIFEIFAEFLQVEVEISNIIFNKKNNLLSIEYNVYKSLNEFLSENGIEKDFKDFSNIAENISLKIFPWMFYSAIFKLFIKKISLKHNFNETTITKKNIVFLKKTFKKLIRKELKAIKLFILSSLSFATGFLLSFYLLDYLDKNINPISFYPLYNNFLSNLFFGLFVLSFVNMVSFFRYSIRRYLFIFTSLLTIILFMLLMNMSFHESSLIRAFRTKHYHSNLIYENTTERVSYKPNDLADIMPKSKFLKLNTKTKYLDIRAEIPIVSQSFKFSSGGMFKKDSYIMQFRKDEIDNTKINYNLSNFYPIEIKSNKNNIILKLNCDFLDKSSIIGISYGFGKFLVFNHNSLHISAYDEWPDSYTGTKLFENNKNLFYAVLTSKNKDLSEEKIYPKRDEWYSISMPKPDLKYFKWGGNLDFKPSGINELLRPIKIIEKHDYTSSTKLYLTIKLIGKTIEVYNNDKLLTVIESITDIGFSDLLIGLNCNLRINTFEYCGVKDLRPEKFSECNLMLLSKDSYQLFTTISDKKPQIIDKTSTYYILYSISGFYKVLGKNSHNTYFIKKEDVTSIEWINQNL